MEFRLAKKSVQDFRHVRMKLLIVCMFPAINSVYTGHFTHLRQRSSNTKPHGFQQITIIRHKEKLATNIQALLYFIVNESGRMDHTQSTR